MPDLAAIRAGIAANITAAISDRSVQVSPYVLSNPIPPCVYVMPAGTEFDITMGNGHDRLMFTIRLLWPATSDIASQTSLDAMCSSTGARSIKAAIEADDSLGGTVDDCQVNTVTAPILYITDQGPPALGVEFELEVIT